MAFEILIERGRYLSDEEKENIQKLINKKENEELARLLEEQELKKNHITEDANAIRLHSRGLIFFFWIFLWFYLWCNFVRTKFFQTQKIQRRFSGYLVGNYLFGNSIFRTSANVCDENYARNNTL